MEKEAYRQHFELEDHFWWFSGKREAIRIFLASLNGKKRSKGKELSILDVGCGTGGMLHFFEQFGKVWGVDLSSEALSFCRKRNQTGKLIQGTVLSLPFSDERFDLVVGCDLLYHQWVANDFLALKELCRVCKKGGHLLLTDSAFGCLKGINDRHLYGVRRYTIGTLRPKVEASGFFVERISYRNMFLFPWMWLWRKVKRNSNDSDLRPLPSCLNQLLTRLFWSEAKVLKYFNLPFGTSLICLAQKP